MGEDKVLTLQDLETEKANLLKQKEQAIGNVNALTGAIQAMEYLIKKLQEPEVGNDGKKDITELPAKV